MRRDDVEEEEPDDDELSRRSHSRMLAVLPAMSTTMECLEATFSFSLRMLLLLALWTLEKGGRGGWEG